LANSRQARKRARQSEKKRRANASQRSMYRTYVKRVYAAIEGGEYETAQQALQTALPIIDKMVTKGIMHKNKAARKKSRMTARVGALAA